MNGLVPAWHLLCISVRRQHLRSVRRMHRSFTPLFQTPMARFPGTFCRCVFYEVGTGFSLSRNQWRWRMGAFAVGDGIEYRFDVSGRLGRGRSRVQLADRSRRPRRRRRTSIGPALTELLRYSVRRVARRAILGWPPYAAASGTPRFRLLPYVTGGLALGDVDAKIPGLPGGSITDAGWTIEEQASRSQSSAMSA